MRASLVLLGILLAAPEVAASDKDFVILATPVSATALVSGTEKGCDGYPPGTIRMTADGAAQLCRP